MKRTRTLFSILMLLISIMLLYYVVNNKEKTSEIIYDTIIKYSKKNVIIPENNYNHRLYLYKTVTETDDFIAKNKDDLKKIYYTILNNGWDTFTFLCDVEYKDCFKESSEVIKSDYMQLINNYISPYNRQTMITTEGIRNELTVKVTKIYTKEETEKLNNIVKKYIEKNKIDKNKVTIKDLEKIHDFIINNVTYDEEFAENAKTEEVVTGDFTPTKATGALIEKKAVCSGYTDAFALFLDELNIPNFKIESMSKKHIWNAVYFNKKWSHFDLTWDDDEINKNNNRNYYMINTKELLKKDTKEHNFDMDLYLEIN